MSNDKFTDAFGFRVPRSAERLIERFGTGALAQAASRAQVCRSSGDRAGFAEWMMVKDLIETMQAGRSGTRDRREGARHHVASYIRGESPGGKRPGEARNRRGPGG